MRLRFLRLPIAALVVTVLSAPSAMAWPGMFLFVGYMRNVSDQQCQSILYDACTTVMGGNCVRKGAGRTLVVNHTGGVYNFSMQCTYFSRIDSVLYGVSGSAERGKDQDLLPRVERIKQYIDQRLR